MVDEHTYVYKKIHTLNHYHVHMYYVFANLHSWIRTSRVWEFAG